VSIPVTRPVLDGTELAALAEVLDSGFLVQGKRVAEFEHLVAAQVGVAHAVALSNGTTALRVALLALGTGPGDKVLVTPYSWIATANVIELCGATPVFVDIDPETYNMDPATLRVELARLADGGELDTVRAIMPVHTFGNPAHLTAIAEIAAEHAIPLVEDAACALGAEEGGRQAGSVGAIGCFSFHPRKIVTTGEGGMLVTGDPATAEFARAFRNHGQQLVGSATEFVMAGDNLRMTDLQGALGVVQMGRLGGLLEARTRLAARYDGLLEPLGFRPQRRSEGAAVQAYVALCPETVAASEVIADLRERGVEATIGTSSIPFTQHFAARYRIPEEDLPCTVAVSRRAVTLPLFPQMTTEEQDVVVATLADVVQAEGA
jgi:dTDP-4-amino-4,6-dideoxygalactose transaminase